MQELDSENSFVVYRLPGSTSSLLQSGKLKQLSAIEIPDQNGFIIAPFNAGGEFPILFLEPEQVFDDENEIRLLLHHLFTRLKPGNRSGTTAVLSKTDYLEKAHLVKGILMEGRAEKVVFSRTLTAERLPNEKFLPLYLSLCETYPSAFVYFAHLPQFGTWMGATPEQLISCRNGKCETMSLAGTRKAGSVESWGKKELEEQEIVTRYLTEILPGYKVKDLKITGPFTRKAGQIEHLCTTIEFEAEQKDQLSKLIRHLHPTPAVCGTPPSKAREIIGRFENHNREYYTGFLGPVNKERHVDLFVNLRCMKIDAEGIKVFAGGGITKDSVPEKEWEETELKARTLLSVIEKLRNLAH